MKNINKWRPSKYIIQDKTLKASSKVSYASNLVVNLVAEKYYDILKKHAKGILIDLGCGDVPLYEAYKNYITECICVDWANTLHDNRHVDYECDLTSKIPLPDSCCDTIIMSDVLEHIPSPDHIWGEISRLLSTKGKLIINIPFYYKIHETPYDYFRYTEYALIYYAHKYNLKTIYCKPIGGFLEIITDILAKHVRHMPIIGRWASIMLQQLMLMFISTNIGNRISKTTQKSFPLGYIMVAEKHG